MTIPKPISKWASLREQADQIENKAIEETLPIYAEAHKFRVDWEKYPKSGYAPEYHDLMNRAGQIVTKGRLAGDKLRLKTWELYHR